MQLRIAARSDVGRVRDNNEDAVAFDRELGLLLLADGMGGYQAGEVASQLAVQRVLDGIRGSGTAARDFPSLQTMLREAVAQANGAIHAEAQRHPRYQGMGTTLVACAAHERRVAVVWVGDSRLYLLRGADLRQITRDHSLVQELVDHGRYSYRDAQQIVPKNIVTRALGVEPQVQIDALEQELEPGDALLLCSDGLTDMLDDAAIATILRRHASDPEAAADELIAEANARGGRDNVSVVLARVDAV